MFNRESILRYHDIDVLHNVFEESCGDARTMKAKTSNVPHFPKPVKSAEGGNILVLDIRKTDIYVIL